jgi:exonuclease VII large subunit
MRTPHIILSLLSAAAFLTGCPSPGEPVSKKSETATPARSSDRQRETVKTETKEAAQAARDYAYAERAEFIAELKRDLEKFELDIEHLEAKVVATTGEANAEAKAKLEKLREKCSEAKKKLDAAEDANETTWNAVKDDARRARDELKDSFDTMRHWLSEKIEPPA